MSQQEFLALMQNIAQAIEGKTLDESLQEFLNAQYPADGEDFRKLADCCAAGERDGWLMTRKTGGIKFGRAVKPGHEAGRMSVDVVRMENVKGPHHIHTQGEIGAVMPINGTPKFDEFAPGWYVYPPGSSHHPTVTGGAAYVLYLLPEGAIEFTGQ